MNSYFSTHWHSNQSIRRLLGIWNSSQVTIHSYKLYMYFFPLIAMLGSVFPELCGFFHFSAKLSICNGQFLEEPGEPKQSFALVDSSNPVSITSCEIYKTYTPDYFLILPSLSSSLLLIVISKGFHRLSLISCLENFLNW